MLFRPQNPNPQAGILSSNSNATDIHIGTIWKSARDKSNAIEAHLREFNGHSYADFRVMQMDSRGRMHPTGKGVTVSLARLGEFAALAGKAYRVAAQRGLTPRST